MPHWFVDAQQDSFLHVNAFARTTGWLHQPLELWAAYGVVAFALLLLAGWWRARQVGGRDRMAAALWAPFGVLLAVAVNQPLGNLVAEPRPYAGLHHVLLLVPSTTDFSFPSDHAVMAGAVAAGLWRVDRRLGVLTGVLAVLMAFTRVYVGAHYPGDVVAGLLVGAVVTTLGLLAARRPVEALVRRGEDTGLRPLLVAR